MTIEDTLNEFQKKRIFERLKLDFNEELEKSKNNLERKRFAKNFCNLLDIFITELYNDGIMFYGFTVLMPNLEVHDSDLWKKTHLAVEDWINSLKIDIELLEFVYIVIDINQQGIPFFKGIIGIRSLIGRNKYLFNEIKKVFNYQHLDCSVISFFSVRDIKNYFLFIIKENNFKFHRFSYYSDFYEPLYGEIMDLELQYDNETRIAFSLDKSSDSKNWFLKGIAELNPHNKTILNYLIIVYMRKKNYYVSNNLLYEKVNDYDYNFVGSIDFLRENNIAIFNFLKQQFPQQLKSLKISSLFNASWNSFYEDIKNNNHYLPMRDNENIIDIFN